MAPHADENTDKLAPLSKSFTVSDDTNVLRAGEFASARRKNSVRSVARSQSVRQPASRQPAPRSGFAPSRSKSLRAPPPPRLELRKDADGKLTLPPFARQDFPSPGRAPRGQRIFDQHTIAEDQGVQLAEPGWATNERTQNKLESDKRKKREEDNGEVQPAKNGRMRSKSFKDILLRR